MRIHRSFLIRLLAGLIISAPIVFRLATAELVDEGRPDYAVPSEEQTFSSAIATPVSMEADGDYSVALERAFSARASELLWSDSLDLGYQGVDTGENVRLAAEAVDLCVLRPHEVFSFNEVVGIRTQQKGYRPGLMYSNGEVVTGVGGGICIVSTFLYRAALETGLRIIERHPHSGPVSYADPGRDAAVSFGWADLRFKNDTEDLIFIRAVVQDGKLVAALYGTKQPGRTVEIVTEDYEEIPFKIVGKEDDTIPEGETEVEQEARPGFAATTVRLIKQNGRVVKREVISRDIVLPRNKVVLVAPKSGHEPADETPGMLPLPDFSRDEPTLPVSPRKEGTIIIPDADEPAPQPEVESPSPAPPENPPRDLPASDRTVSTAWE